MHTHRFLSENELTEMPQLGPGGGKLVRLNLAQNRIHAVDPKSLEQLSSLKHLDLSSNGVVDLPLGAFPKACEKLTSL